MHQRLGALVVLAAVAVVGPAAAQGTSPGAESPPGQAASPRASAVDPGRLLATLHRVNDLQMELGELAKARGKDPRVRRFASLVVEDHRRADAMVLAYARKHRITLPPPSSQREMEQRTAREHLVGSLRAASGKELDAAFTSLELELAVRLGDVLTDAMPAIGEPGLRSMVEGLVPIIAQHRDIARVLEARTTT